MAASNDERITVIFDRPWRMYNAGEAAGFSARTANDLVNRGIAHFDPRPAEVAALLANAIAKPTDEPPLDVGQLADDGVISKERDVATYDALTDIADRARVLSTLAPECGRKLCQSLRLLNDLRNDSESGDALNNARHDVTCHRSASDEAAKLLEELATLVYRHLPTVAPQWVRISPSWRFDDVIVDWDAITAELKSIEDAALREREGKPKGPDVAAKLLTAAKDWQRGENVSDRLCETAAAVLAADEPEHPNEQSVDIPADYRYECKPDGEPLTAPYLYDRLRITSYQLTREFDDKDSVFSKRLPTGKTFVYKWEEVTAMLKKRHEKEAKRAKQTQK